MCRNRIALLSAFLCCGVFALTSLPSSASAADLTGKTLKPAVGVKFGMESALGTLLGGTIAGEVSNVVVTRDEPGQIVLTVSYTGFAGGKLWGELAGSDRKPQKALRGTPPEALEASAGDVDLSFQLDPDAPENLVVKTAYLRVCVAKSDKTTPSYVKAFELPKTWQTGTRPENFVVSVTPKPIGTTASLGPTPSAPLPPRVIRPDFTRVSRAAMPARSLTLQRAATAPQTTAPQTTPPPPAQPTATRSIGVSSTRAVMMTAPTARMMTPNAAVIAKTDSATKLLPRTAMVASLSKFRFGVGQEDQNKGAKGPSGTPVEPLGELRSEDIDLDASHVLGVFPAFYPDQQASSGIYYFLPYSYSLRWSEDGGYDLRMIYSAAASEGQSGEVAIAARLDAGLGLRERQIASDLMAAYARSHGLPFTALRALPIDSISVSIADDLRRYNIPSEKIAVTGLSDFLGQIDISWLTDPVTKENLQQALIEDVGISGRVTLYPAGGKLAPVDVPIQIRIADFVTFGPFRWNRAEAWRNQTLYPIKLKYLNALVIDASSRPIVYSWDLASTTVPPTGRAQWLAGAVPGWIDSQAKRIWLEYAVDASCGGCDETVIRSITGGVSTSGPSAITFHTITPLADAGGYEIAAQVRSKYFDPQSDQLQTKTVVFNSDGKDFTLGPVYLGARQPGEPVSGEPLFEYFLTLTMKDGATYKATRWISSDDLRLAIGKHQLEEALGALPGPK
jgi:hypothetical protein